MAFAIASPVFCAEKAAKFVSKGAVVVKDKSLLHLLMAGGEVMVPLAFLSIVTLAIVIYHFFETQREKLIPEGFFKKVSFLIESKKIEEARAICNGSYNMISEVVLAGLSKKGRDIISIEEAMKERGKHCVSDLWQRLSYLADVAAIAPLLGLLGTVIGIIQAFNGITFETGVEPMVLVNGMSKALVATATGIFIAVPAMMFYAYFRGVIHGIVTDFEGMTSDLFDLITDSRK